MGSFSTVDVEHLEATQYLSVIGLTILLWDHVVTFPDEVRLIWPARLSVPKVLFFFNRYMVPFTMIIQLHEFSGLSTYLSLKVSACKVWYAITISVGTLSIAISNFLVLLRLWALWDRCPRLVLGTLVFFVATQCVSLGLSGYVIHQLLPTLKYNPLLHICATVKKPPFVLLWSPGIAFEFMIFFMTLWNTLDRPRRQNAAVAEILYRDGSLYFLVLFVLHLLNLIVSVVAPASLVFLGVFFFWSISNITLTRLILTLRRLSTDAAEDDQEDDETTLGDTEHIELTMLPRRGSSSGHSVSDPESPHKLAL